MTPSGRAEPRTRLDSKPFLIQYTLQHSDPGRVWIHQFHETDSVTTQLIPISLQLSAFPLSPSHARCIINSFIAFPGFTVTFTQHDRSPALRYVLFVMKAVHARGRATLCSDTSANVPIREPAGNTILRCLTQTHRALSIWQLLHCKYVPYFVSGNSVKHRNPQLSHSQTRATQKNSLSLQNSARYVWILLCFEFA